MTAEEYFERPFNSASIQNITHNGTKIIPIGAFADGEDGVAIGLEPESGFSPGDTVKIVYEVSIPDSATDGEQFNITGESAVDDQSPVMHTGDNRIIIEGQQETPTPTLTPTPAPGTTPSPTPTSTEEGLGGGGGGGGGGNSISDDSSRGSETVGNTPKSTTDSSSKSTQSVSSEKSTETSTESSTTTSKTSNPSTTSPTEEVVAEVGGDGAGFGSLVAILASLVVSCYFISIKNRSD